MGTGRAAVSGGAAAIALVVTVGVAGCAGPAACTAIGWANGVEVTLLGDTAAVATVTACGGAGCTPPTADEPLADPPEAALGSTPTPVSGGVRWPLHLGMDTPSRGAVAVYDQAGTLLSAQAVRFRWDSPHAADPCGGPSSGRVTVRLPASPG
ncbi:hypothetical protein [Curtobacterium herbarum]|uniref:Uncharacterized protein n=1 Tax=Curtobacterium herbarum TaxID=150122 RepID=A0ABP4K9T1_9MICO|nr:hypothetical protein [Curtobacterium herbarum]MBM7475526.1 hypothetical protein [Curtobacterium herbarum]MCS6543441.1 hypothetical protein [Curtobacterium herbarum]